MLTYFLQKRIVGVKADKRSASAFIVGHDDALRSILMELLKTFRRSEAGRFFPKHSMYGIYAYIGVVRGSM